MEDSRGRRGLEGPVKGDIVIIDFPFSDLSAVKRRPALVLQPLRNETILLQITTNLWVDDFSIPLGPDDFTHGFLRATSMVHADTIFTASNALILYKAGKVTPEKLDEVVGKVCALIRQQ